MSESMFEGLEPGGGSANQSGGEPPAGGTPEGQQDAPQAKTDGPQSWETVDDFVKALAGGKYQKPEDAIKGYSELSKLQQEASAKAKALEAKLVGHKGAPVDAEGNPVPYEIAFPEGFTGEMDELLVARANEIGRKMNLSQDAMQALFQEVYVPSMAGSLLQNQQRERAALVEHYGTEDAANEVLSETFEWLTSVLPEDARGDIVELGSTAAGVRTAHRLKKAFNSVQLPDGSAGGGVITADTLAAKTNELGMTHPRVIEMRRQYAEQEVARRKQAGTL